MSDGLGGQVAAELGSHHPTVAVSSGHFAPDHSGLVGFTARRHRVPAHRRHALFLQDGPAGWSRHTPGSERLPAKSDAKTLGEQFLGVTTCFDEQLTKQPADSEPKEITEPPVRT